MKQRQWKTIRQFLERPHAQRRWDQAYQALMNWTLAPTSSSVVEGAQPSQEESDENSRLRPSFHPEPDPDANH